MCSSKTPLKVLFVRPKYSSWISRKVQLITEPLDLEYLAAAAAAEGWEYMIHDPVVTNGSFESVLAGFAPDIIAISGYYPAKDTMLDYARRTKRADDKILTLIGGVHAEINYHDFYSDSVDLIVHSGGTETFGKILPFLSRGVVPVNMAGTCHRSEQGKWICNERAPLDLTKLPEPDRSFFYEHYEQFTYLHYGPVALIKTAYGCPFDCKFCYCRLLDEGRYSARELAGVVEEIKGIRCDRIWIVDDTFLLDMDRIRSFAALLKREGVRKEFIIYSRSEFIANNPEVVPLLKEMGVIDVIIGFETISGKKLDDYDKSITEEEGRRCIKLLREERIECTGLFIMDVDAAFSDFRALDGWIREAGLTTYTLSVFSPYPGTGAYEEYKDRLTTSDCRKWDLLHLVVAPTGMSRTAFYLLMAWAHVKVLLRNKRLRKHVFSPARRRRGGVS